jgi:pimeloyl-ACP methyl ester carboxylesterase
LEIVDLALASSRQLRHRGRRLQSVLLAGMVLALSLVSGACAGVGAQPGARIAWQPCPKVSGYLCGTLKVPLDYAAPSRGSVNLAVMERPVPQSKGVMVFNPGGPGESGDLILPILASLMPQAVKAQFTFVSFDERGTGSSDPLLCGPSAAAAGSAIAGTAAATQTFAGLERSCQADSPTLFPTVNTTTSARDMDQLRVALGVKRIDYYGLSYGTALGSVYAHLFPSHVRSMVLDGAVDANLSLITDATADAAAIQTALVHALHSCTALPSCPLGANPVSFYQSLQQRLVHSPLRAPGGGDTTPVTAGDLSTASLLYLSAPTFTPGYFPAVAAAAAGNGAPLRSVALGLEDDLNGASLVGPLWTITCNDAVLHPDATATAALARSLAARYPLGGAEAVANYLIACPGWTGSNEAIAHLAPNGVPTPLVIGNVYDPNTPYVVAPQLASAIGGRLVTYVGYGHTWLLNGSTNACMANLVTSYFVGGVVPAKGTRCTASS